jgi:hypothetical protein
LLLDSYYIFITNTRITIVFILILHLSLHHHTPFIDVPEINTNITIHSYPSTSFSSHFSLIPPPHFTHLHTSEIIPKFTL